MKRMKHAATFAMAAALATATILSVSPAVATADKVPSATIHASTSGVITPEDTRTPLTSPISGSSWKNSFYVDPNYGWVKVWIQNTSSDTLHVRVTQSSLTGTEKMKFDVAPNDQHIEYAVSPWAVGTHWVSITSATGSQMSGNMSVKIGTTLEELKQ